MLRSIIATLVLAIALTVLSCNTSASAETRITNDPGGEVSAYVNKYESAARAHEHIVIDGPCLSACTLLTHYVPRISVCVTQRAMLGFHAASYVNDATNRLEPTRRGTELVMQLYPAGIKNWIRHNGGLTARIIELRGAQLQKFYPLCN